MDRNKDVCKDGLDGLQTMSRMLTFAREASQAFPHSSIEAFNKRGLQFSSSPSRLKQLLCLLKRSQGHLAGDFDDGLMHLLAVLSCSPLPLSYGAFIHSIGMHNRLDWASIRQ